MISGVNFLLIFAKTVEYNDLKMNTVTVRITVNRNQLKLKPIKEVFYVCLKMGNSATARIHFYTWSVCHLFSSKPYSNHT